LAALVVATVVSAPLSSEAGTVAHFRFENSGNLGLDETGNHNGTPVNGPTQSALVGQNPVWQTGASNTGSLSLDFTGPADHIVVPDDNALDFGNNPWTIEAYVNLTLETAPTTLSTGQYVVQKKDAAPDTEGDYSLLIAGARGTLPTGITYFDNGSYVGSGRNLQVEFGVGPGNLIAFRSVLEIPASGWAHISAAYDGSQTVRFTLDTNLNDGVIDASETIVAGSSFTPTINAGALFIGAKRNGVGNPAQGFNGLIDEVRISNTVLDQTQLLTVPEPTSLALLAGCGVFSLVRRRRRR
jgi:hypothetical protein